MISTLIVPSKTDCDCICPECKWEGKIRECNPKPDETVVCPKCGHWVELKQKEKNT